jgi:hypothetical protein
MSPLFVSSYLEPLFLFHFSFVSIRLWFVIFTRIFLLFWDTFYVFFIRISTKKDNDVIIKINKNLQVQDVDLDLWPWKSIRFQILLRSKYVPSLVKIHWRMLILVFIRMLCSKYLTPWSLTLKINYLVLRRVWNPIDFQGRRSRSPGQIFTT